MAVCKLRRETLHRLVLARLLSDECSGSDELDLAGMGRDRNRDWNGDTEHVIL
jgi:hypothetical protein